MVLDKDLFLLFASSFQTQEKKNLKKKMRERKKTNDPSFSCWNELDFWP